MVREAAHPHRNQPDERRAVNDHLLKYQWPGFVTGKLSDIAGLAVIAILLAMLVRPASAVALTAAGFIALKAVPGVNVLAAPLLRGVTIADRSDLLASCEEVRTRRARIR